MTSHWPGRSLGRAVARFAVAAFVLTGCTDAAQTSYVFKPGTSPVEVDSPQLRAQKAAAGIADCPRSSTAAKSVAGGLPDLTLPCLGGGRDVHLAGLTGTPSVVNFWSQTCGPCRQESPILQRVHQAASGRVRILGIDWEDSQPGQALAFAKELGLTYPQIADPDAATRAPLHIAGLPLTFFVASSGAIVYAKYGPITSVGQLTRLVSDRLGVDVHVERGP